MVLFRVGILISPRELWGFMGLERSCTVNYKYVEIAILATYFLTFLTYNRVGRRNLKTLRHLESPLSAELCRHCVLNGGTKRHTLPRHQSEEFKI